MDEYGNVILESDEELRLEAEGKMPVWDLVGRGGGNVIRTPHNEREYNDDI